MADNTVIKHVTVGNEDLVLVPVKYEDIHSGDTVVHLVEEKDLDGNAFITNVFMGVVSDHAQNTGEWYGDGRKSSTASQGGYGPLEDFVVNDREGVLIVAPWHETEAGHSLWLAQ